MPESLSPVIKWTGSKRSQAKFITEKFPEFDAYYEPFVGGGSILAKSGAKKAVCGDICEPLIKLWESIRDDPAEVILYYNRRWSDLRESGQEAYYSARRDFNENQNPLDLLFLTRTSMNGLIRFNKKGEFNSPFHHTRYGIKPESLATIIWKWSRMIRDYEFVCGDYRNTTEEACRNDFVYMDPPYNNSRGMYYGTIDFRGLLSHMEDLNARGVKFALSFDGTRGSESRMASIPDDLYERHYLVESGNSSFSKVTTGKRVPVTESLYLNY